MKLKSCTSFALHAFFFIFLFSLFIWQGYKCWNLYARGETSVKMGIYRAGFPRFPAIGISPGWNKSALGGLGIREAKYQTGINWTSKTMTPDEIFEKISVKLFDVLDSVSIFLKDGSIIVINSSMGFEEILRTWSGPKGQVYILHFKGDAGYHDIGIETILLDFNNLADFEKLTISLQHAGRMFAPEIQDSTFKLERGLKTIITSRYSTIMMMDKPTYQCSSPEVDDKYPYDDCVFHLTREKLHQEVGCVVPWLHDPDSQALDICGPDKAKKAADIFYNSSKSASCMQPCCTMEVDMLNRFSTPLPMGQSREEGASLEMRFPPTVKFYMEIEVYALVSMLAELGGYLGMLLGISIFDLRFFVDYLSTKTEQKQRITAVEPINYITVKSKSAY